MKISEFRMLDDMVRRRLRSLTVSHEYVEKVMDVWDNVEVDFK
jgi:hypothetical protein